MLLVAKNQPKTMHSEQGNITPKGVKTVLEEGEQNNFFLCIKHSNTYNT